MDYTTCFNIVMVPNLMSAEFNYNGDNSQWILTIGFKSAFKSRSDVKFTVLRNDEPAGIREAEMTEVESFVKIPFMARHGDNINYEVMNCTDTTDMIITHVSIGV